MASTIQADDGVESVAFAGESDDCKKSRRAMGVAMRTRQAEGDDADAAAVAQFVGRRR